MDTVTFTLTATDSSAPTSTATDDETSAMSELSQNAVVQAAGGVLVLLALMGLLVLRGQRKSRKADANRLVRAKELRERRGIVDSPFDQVIRTPEPARHLDSSPRGKSSSAFNEFKGRR